MPPRLIGPGGERTKSVAGQKRWWLGGGLLVALGVGWLLSELMNGQSTPSPSRIEVDRQVSALLSRREQEPLSSADERRLIERLLALGRLPETIVLVEEQLAAQPKAWRWRLLLSQLQLRNGNPKAAETQLLILMRLQPNELEVLQTLALLRLQQGRHLEAVKSVQSALSASPTPERMPIGLLLADLQRQSGSPSAALSTYQQLSKEAPQDARPLLAEAVLRQEQGERKRALALLETARQRQMATKTDTQALDALAARWGLVTNRARSLGEGTTATEPNLGSATPTP